MSEKRVGIMSGLIPERDKREIYNHEVKAAYEYVTSVRDTADNQRDMMWHGWALREAFLACITYAQQMRGEK